MKTAVFGLLAATTFGTFAIAAPTTDKPQYGTFGFDRAGQDKDVAPGDDFYAFSNGRWARETPIPADKSSYGMYEQLQDLSDARVRGILEQASFDPQSRIGTAYTTFLDHAVIERNGLKPIRSWIARIRAATRETYPELIASASNAGIAVPFLTQVDTDDRNPDRYVLTITQAGLGMPDRENYLSDDTTLIETRSAYRKHLTRMLELAEETDAATRADAIVDFETTIARASWTATVSRDAGKTYNMMPLAELAAIAPGFDFRAFIAGLGGATDSLIVGQPTAVAGIAKAIRNAPLNVLKDQLLVRSLEAYSSVLPQKIDDQRFDFYGRTLSGQPEQPDRWKRATRFVQFALEDDIGQAYVAKYFPPATKAAIDNIVVNIVAAMGERIDKLDWMAPATKARARRKLAAITPKIGYPSRWKDSRSLKVIAGDAFGNYWRAREWRNAYEFSHLGKSRQRWEWWLSPMVADAYASFNKLEIVFPTAYLQPPNFDPNADLAINYGGIGTVIGHELSHHFDDQGARYDENGRLNRWWTDKDEAAFRSLSQALVRQFDSYEELPGLRVQGALTLGENSADLAGLLIAYDAYRKALGGKPAPVIDGLTGDQRFFLGWAQTWRRNFRDAYLRQHRLTDPHAPSGMRANTVRNVDAWYAAFNPQPGQKLYLKPSDRVRIW